MGQLLCISGSDDFELHGYLEEAGRETLLLHYHGLAGNFYENWFVHRFASEAKRRGLSFATVNSRAHDHLSDSHCRSSVAVRRRGAAHTSTQEIRADLLSWYRYARDQGFKRVVLQGHSAGAVAVTDMVWNHGAEVEIVGLALISPTDMVGLQEQRHGAVGSRALIDRAASLVQSGRSSEMMAADVWPGYRFDAATYLDLFSPDGAGDMFDFRSPNRLRRLRRLGVPILGVFGGGLEVCPVPVEEALAALKRELMPDLRVVGKVIPAASHSYRLHEGSLVETVLTWIQGIL